MRSGSVSRRRYATVALAALVAVVLAAAVFFAQHERPARAATPASGTVSKSAPTVSYSAGPFAVPNTTGAAGDPQCGSAATPCDDFNLTVNVPADYKSTHQLKVQIQWPDSAADFDLYLLDSKGNTVATSASSADPEVVIVPPVSGKYTVRVVPYAPAGQSFRGTISLQNKPSNPPAANETPPGYKNYPAPENLKNSHNAGEPSIGSNWNTGSAMYQAYTSTYKVTFDDTKSPATATWQDKSATATNGCPQGSTASLDPILFTDHETGRTFESQLSGQDSLTCFTDNDGDTWTPSQGGGIVSGVDHQTIGGGPFSSNAPGALAPNVYKNAVYYCSQDIETAFCATSRDGGLTFATSTPIYNSATDGCGGLHGHVKVAPDGTVYVPNKGCGGNQAVAVSTDNGATWTVRKNPKSTPGDSDPSVGIGAGGSVYLGYQSADDQPRIAVSGDRGKTWNYDQDVGAQLGIKNIVFPTVVAGDDNRAAFAFLGTKTEGDYQDRSTFHGVWHLYVATTFNGGKNWVTRDVTPNDPVQRGSICTEGTTCGNDRNLLDFIDVTVDKQGRPLVGYADGCTGKCVSATGDKSATYYYDALATIARQTSGKRLFARYDPAAQGGTDSGGASNGGSACTITGTNGPDILRGTNGRDVICGNGGNDVLRGFGGNDALYGGNGNDALYGGNANDYLNGGTGRDSLFGEAGSDGLNAKDGTRANDTANGGSGRDSCSADRGDTKRSCP